MGEKWPQPDSDIIKALFAESDRGCVLVAAAFLEEQIKVLLRYWYLTDFDDRLGLIDEVLDGKNMSVTYGSASWATKKVVKLGLIKDPQLAKAIEKINRLRNEFAHVAHRGVLLQDEVQQIRACLGSHQSVINGGIKAARKTKADRPLSEPRIVFMAIAVFLWFELWTLIRGVVAPLAVKVEEYQKGLAQAYSSMALSETPPLPQKSAPSSEPQSGALPKLLEGHLE